VLLLLLLPFLTPETQQSAVVYIRIETLKFSRDAFVSRVVLIQHRKFRSAALNGYFQVEAQRVILF